MSAHALDKDLDAVAVSARAELVRVIGLSGAWDADPGWRAVFAAVPRHLFVPYYYVGVPDGDGRGHERLWRGSADPAARERWLRGVYADVPLATRLRDGELVSSSSQPSLMARMLAELRVTDGDRVLEIGAGTGYNAALLAHRLGDDLVTTVDLEPEITDSARTHLADAGYRPAVVTGDGTRGVPAHGPYDRIVATCALTTVPRAWIAQCRPGARVLAPLATGLIALTVRDGAHAEGTFLDTAAYFVPLRGTEPTAPSEIPHRPGDPELLRFLLTLTHGTLAPQDARELWEREGRPGRERYGVTVAGERVWAWLDDPEEPYTWPLR
ncbi:methyltransferase domain-containing protein [Streptomyces sp. MBT65]|uniref:methyltransferase domain-containing protein n=1 Tax=Streptomyces sp. MBT65 TaxID=1488395 RepID=UPI001909C246|nr:methyltransferase domain-containing protein [Streptomyces sp. MBT65]MBK3575895.1 methyltransferase domain-containing protein [Streptomyces sp. MBT65]